jgi:hypothetical protein
MKILTAFVTVLALLGFGATAFAACDGVSHGTQATAQDDNAPPVWPPADRG